MPCSLLRCNRRFGGTYSLHLQGRRQNFQQEPASKQVVASQQTTRRHIPEDDTLHIHRCENLKSYSRELVSLKLSTTWTERESLCGQCCGGLRNSRNCSSAKGKIPRHVSPLFPSAVQCALYLCTLAGRNNKSPVVTSS
jgi:hypothetical protein